MSKVSKGIILTFLMLIIVGSSYTLFYPNNFFNREEADVYFQKGITLYNDYNYDAAADFFSEALSRNSTHYMAKRMLGQALYFAGNISEAQSEWTDLLQNQTNDDPALSTHLHNLNPVSKNLEANYQYLKSITPTLGSRYQYPSFIGQTPNRNIFALSVDGAGVGAFMELDSNGNFINTIRNISGKLEMPVSGAFSQTQFWVTDYKTDNIRRMKWRKEAVLNQLPFINMMPSLGNKGSKPLEFRGPAGICYLDGYFFVVDNGNHRIQKIAEDGTFSLTFSEINEETYLNQPFGIACHKSGKIYVAETGAHRISIFDQFGGFEEHIGENFLERPKHIHFNYNQTYLTIADEKGKVFIYNNETREIKKLESFDISKQNDDKFLKPYSAFIDSLHNLYVADYSAKKILQFAPTDFLFNNLEVWVERVDATSFPTVALWLSIKDPAHNTTIGLDEKAFSIFENEAQMYDIRSDYLEQFSDQMNLVIVVSRTNAMKGYNEALQRTLSFIMSDLRVKDKIQIIEYDEIYKNVIPWTNSKYALKEAIQMQTDMNLTNQNAKNEEDMAEIKENRTGSALGDALYYAGTTLLKKRGKRAIVWISEGELHETGFNNQSMSKIEYFLQNNHIPLYSISFENPAIKDILNKKNEIQNFSNTTGGSYYRAYDSSLKDIYKYIRSKEEEMYVLYYKSHASKSLNNQFINLKVVVEFQNRVGKEISGFFIPNK